MIILKHLEDHEWSFYTANQSVSPQVPDRLWASAVPRPRGVWRRVWSPQQSGRLQLRHQKNPPAQ